MENDEVKDYELDEDALEEGDGYRVKLDSFEGPLDLLLHLIKRSKIRICDIFVSDITGQNRCFPNPKPHRRESRRTTAAN